MKITQFFVFLLASLGVFAQPGPLSQVNVRNIERWSVTNRVKVEPIGTNSFVFDSYLTTLGAQRVFTATVLRDTTAGGIAAGDCLAPVIVLTNVAASSTNSSTLHQMFYLSGDNTTTNDFKLLICSSPITWGETNAAFNGVVSELATNLLDVIKSSDTRFGSWMTIGTNRLWTSDGLSKLLKPATNSLYLYFINDSAITNTNSAYASFKFFLN